VRLLLCLVALVAASLATAGAAQSPQDIQFVIDKAERHFKQGELSLKDRNYEAARGEFDKAVDAVLESGIDVRSNPRLHNYYLQLVDRVHRMDFSGASAPRAGLLKDQKFEPSPLDALASPEGYEDGLGLLEDVRESASPRCAPGALNKFSVRGFSLGMSAREVAARVPGLRVTGGKHGVTRSVVVLRGTKDLAARPALKGLSVIFFDFLDGKLATVTAFYDESIKWRDSHEFAAQVAQAYGIPAAWNTVDEFQTLTCGDVRVTAGLTWIRGAKLPVVYLADLRAAKARETRIESEERRRRMEEERRKRAFKP
jgi:hypothetical protein